MQWASLRHIGPTCGESAIKRFPCEAYLIFSLVNPHDRLFEEEHEEESTSDDQVGQRIRNAVRFQ